jgi:hypothetical protein
MYIPPYLTQVPQLVTLPEKGQTGKKKCEKHRNPEKRKKARKK